LIVLFIELNQDFSASVEMTDELLINEERLTEVSKRVLGFGAARSDVATVRSESIAGN
jgi:hypothetical protein